MRKQMEGDNEQRRNRAKEARREGSSPSAEGVTTGASKQNFSLDRDEDHTQKMQGPGRGKQDPERTANPMRPRSRD